MTAPERHAAYRAGQCVDCRAVPYSAGRPRCDDCHAAYTAHLTVQPPPPRTSWEELLADALGAEVVAE